MAFSAHDVVPDSPTNTFATLNPLVYSETANTFTEGNLKASSSGNNQQVATIAMQGKVYWEFIDLNGNSSLYFSDDSDFTTKMYYNATNRASIFRDGTSGATGSLSWTVNSGSLFSWTTNDLIGVAYDADNHTLQLTKNGGSAVNLTINGLSGDTMLAVLGNYSSGSSNIVFANFGQDPTFNGAKTPTTTYTDANGIGSFYYQPPAGALALCTANLPDPTIDPAQDDVPEDYMKSVLYTGTNGNLSINVGFQPDLVWLKSRDSTTVGHSWQDSLRTPDPTDNNFTSYPRLVSNTTDAEEKNSGLISFDTNGFSLNNDAFVNKIASGKLVAWCWKAGGAPSADGVAMVDGTATTCSAIATAAGASIIPTRMSVNTKAGFSIVSYTGIGSAATVGHGLSSAPEMIIVKCRNFEDNAWMTYHNGVASDAYTDYLRLDTLDAAVDNNTVWNDAAPTSSVFSVGTSGGVNYSTGTFIAYCWHSVPGYSKFGSYKGIYSQDGPFVYTGFRPAWVMIKCAVNTAFQSYTSWIIYDNEMNTYNTMNNVLYANLAVPDGYRGDGASTGSILYLDFTSNGFKIKNNGAEANGDTGITYIYAAFAEQPFKYANAR